MVLKSSYIIRFSDCDPLGHLNNARYIDYLLNAREDHLREHHELSIQAFHQQGIGWVVSGHEIQYIKPARYNEWVVITSALIEAGPGHLWVEMSMWDKDEKMLKAICWTRFVPVNVQTGKKEEHHASFMDFAHSVLQRNIPVADGLKKRIAVVLGKE